MTPSPSTASAATFGAIVGDQVLLWLAVAGVAALLATHRPAMNPLVLLGGQYFSAGRLPRRKLEAYLRQDARVLKVDSRG